MSTNTRQILGALAFDVPIFLSAMLRGGDDYLATRNRHELLERAPAGSGYRCLWKWTSELNATRIFPPLGRHLLRVATRRHPIERAASPAGRIGERPELSFLIGHRGVERLPLLVATLETIAAQTGVRVECIVVEQDTKSHLNARLPPWVRLIHTPPPDPAMPFCRSWAFNVAAKQALSEVLVLHDNDMLIPADYASQILACMQQGYQVANLKRFIFYLNEVHSRGVAAGEQAISAQSPESIVQNLEGGGSVAIAREAFNRIGGMDESFIGWGGEDNEFWERAQSLRVWPYANLPIVHLWHRAQPGKGLSNSQTHQYYQQRAAVPVSKRIAQLRVAVRGNPDGPNPGVGLKEAES